MLQPDKIKFFKTSLALRKWFEKNHSKKDELWIAFYKKSSGKPSVTYLEAVDNALSFGWIDGLVKGIDAQHYCQRFTPRRKNSIWSAINLKKADALIKKGLMAPAGLKVYNERNQKRPHLYSIEQKNLKLPPALERTFRSNKKSWENFNNMVPSYKKPAIWLIINAKQEETRQRRLEELIRDSEAGRKVKQLRRPGE